MLEAMKRKGKIMKRIASTWGTLLLASSLSAGVYTVGMVNDWGEPTSMGIGVGVGAILLTAIYAIKLHRWEVLRTHSRRLSS